MGDNDSNGNANGQKNEVTLADLMARFEALEKAVGVQQTAAAPVKASTGRKVRKNAKEAPEKWETVGKAAETVQDARAFSQRVSVRVQKSSKGREQVHLYHQVAVPADRVRADKKGLEEQTVTRDGKQVKAFWLNQRNPIIIRGDAAEAIKSLSALIKSASK